MHAVRLDEIREAAGTTDASDSRDLLVPELALLNQLEVKGEHGEIAAARAPGGMVRGDFFFGQPFAFGVWKRWYDRNVAASRGNVGHG